MATKNAYIGPIHLTYDNADPYTDDGSTRYGARFDEQIRVDTAPTLSTHVIRKNEFDAIVASAVSVADLSAPTELASLVGTEGQLKVAYQGGDATIYRWTANTETENSPYIVAGSSGYWIAVAGNYVDGSVTYTGSVTCVGDLLTTAFLNIGNPGIVGGWETISAVTDQITPTKSFWGISAAAPYTLTSTPTIPNGTNIGQLLIIQGLTTSEVTVQGETTLPLSGLFLGAATRAIRNSKILGLIWDGSYWRELFYSQATN